MYNLSNVTPYPTKLGLLIQWNEGNVQVKVWNNLSLSYINAPTVLKTDSFKVYSISIKNNTKCLDITGDNVH